MCRIRLPRAFLSLCPLWAVGGALWAFALTTFRFQAQPLLACSSCYLVSPSCLFCMLHTPRCFTVVGISTWTVLESICGYVVGV